MSLTGLLLGIVNIAIVVIVLLLIGAIAEWLLKWLGVAVDAMVRKLYIAVVALIALYMLIALLAGLPSLRLLPIARAEACVAWGLPCPS
jgi:hypothetical protein